MCSHGNIPHWIFCFYGLFVFENIKTHVHTSPSSRVITWTRLQPWAHTFIGWLPLSWIPKFDLVRSQEKIFWHYSATLLRSSPLRMLRPWERMPASASTQYAGQGLHAPWTFANPILWHVDLFFQNHGYRSSHNVLPGCGCSILVLGNGIRDLLQARFHLQLDRRAQQTLVVLVENVSWNIIPIQPYNSNFIDCLWFLWTSGSWWCHYV